jgi:hypothetical protein
MHRQVVLHHITTLLSLRHHCKAPLVAAQTVGKGFVTQSLFCVGQDGVMLKRRCLLLQLEWAGWGGFVIVCAMTITIIANACYNHMPYVGRDGEPICS